ncbi:hypothetical protein GGS23DRAFT_616202 [Durotheca rogersii]|uniref:uncharacterized protein n=1 Tax=Durotheca rogersii TaxID=419775 RepID=UPI002220C2BB|nr:uncharacterized protein GGS23DRAFT_616202 [Durotheca rogersii]KAI5859515.1 hypothetical protein GGS23DRAFT_616202 [Durotheca rogersii]
MTQAYADHGLKCKPEPEKSPEPGQDPGQTPKPELSADNKETLPTAKEYTHGYFDRMHNQSEVIYEDITVEQARELSEPQIANIWMNFKHLQAIIHRHEALIQKRWIKKSKVKRSEILQSAWGPRSAMNAQRKPNMALVMNRFKGWDSTKSDNEKAGASIYQALIWPQINIEDLTKTEPLLLFLNARARYPPSTFAHTDVEPAMFAADAQIFPGPKYLDRWSMRFTGRDSVETYGRLVSWDEDEDAYQRLQRGRDFTPGEGIWILDSQERIYQFLCDICRIILHDYSLGMDELHNLPIEPEPPLPETEFNEDAPEECLLSSSYRCDYHVPASMDVKRLVDLFESRLAEAEDRLWLLREDPASFLDEAYGWLNTSACSIARANGKPQANMETAGRRYITRIYCAHEALNQRINMIKVWEILCRKANTLLEAKERLFDKTNARLRPEDDLPVELSNAFQELGFTLNALVVSILYRIRFMIQSSAQLRHLYVWKPSNEPDHPGYIRTNEATKPNPAELEVMQLVQAVECTADGSMGPYVLTQELQRLCRDRVTRKLISSRVAGIMPNLCIMTETMRQIESFQPWMSSLDVDQNKWKSAHFGLDTEVQTLLEYTNIFTVRTRTKGPISRAIYALMKGGCPVDKPPTPANLKAIATAERHLDTMWGHLKAELDEVSRSGRGGWARIQRIIDNGRAERTPMPADEPGAPEENNKPSASDPDGAQPFGQMNLGHQAEPHRAPVRAQTKAKPKTRPAAPASAPNTGAASAAAPASPPPASPQPFVLAVDRRTQRTLTALFSPAAGPVPWADLQHALGRAGFRREPVGGSAWQFTPGAALARAGGPAYARGIQLHEPHPGSKIPPLLARQFGRRLARAYGWSAESFCLEEKGAGEEGEM